MANYIPVDHDPFADNSLGNNAPAIPKLVPVDHDPFAPSFLQDNILRPVERAGKSIAVGTVGTLGDLGQTVMNAAAVPGNWVAAGIDKLTGGDVAQRMQAMQQGQQPASQVLGNAIDQLTEGATIPRNDIERIVDKAGTVVSSAMIPGAIGATGPLAVRNAPELINTALSGIGAGVANEMAPGNPYAEMAGAIGGGSVLSVGSGALRASLGAKPQVAQEFSTVGIDPNLAAIGGRGSRIVANTLKETPFAGKVIEESMQKTLQQIQNKIGGIADQLSPAVTPAEAGSTLLKGTQGFVQRFQNTADSLYKKIDDYIPKETPVPVTNALNFFQKQAEELASTPSIAKELDNPKLAGIRQGLQADAAQGTLPYNAVSGLRSKIGRMISTPSIISDVPTSELKQLYDALSQDMREAARAQGPAVLKAFDRANNYYSSGMNRIEQTIDNVIKQVDPEKAFNQLASGTRQGAAQYNTIKKSLLPEERQALESVMIRQMGKATPGAQDASGGLFSASNFLTNYNRLSERSKALLLSGNGELRESFNRLLQVASRVKDVDKLANPSGTGRVAGTTSLGIASILSPKVLALVPVGLGTAKLMTNPKFVNWLAKSEAVSTPEQMASHIAKLAAISQASTDLAPDIHDYLKRIHQGQVPSADMSQPQQ